MATLGSLLRGAGYRSSYIGKWHLSQSEHPDMEAYGFADWDGNDRHFMGWAGTGVHFDPIIASNAAQWLRANAPAPARRGRRALVLDRGTGEPARRHVVPHRPTRVRGAQPRGRGVGAPGARCGGVEGRRPPSDLPPGLRRGRRGAPGQLPRRPPHQARSAPAMAMGPAARAVGLHRPRRHEGVAASPRLLRGAPASRRREPGDGARRPRG